MKICKKIATLLMIMSLAVTNSVITAIAAETSIQKMDKQSIVAFSKDIVEATLSKNHNKYYEYSYLFSQQVMEQLIEFSDNFDEDLTTSQYCVDYVEPSYSSTGDLVLLINVKAYTPYGDNNLLLFEFHVNEDSQVYGAQVWMY